MWAHAAYAAMFAGFIKSWGAFAVLDLRRMATEKVRTRWRDKGILCLVLDCAVKRGVAYCMRDCEEFPCEKHFEWLFPYGEAYLEMHIKGKTEQEKEEK